MIFRRSIPEIRNAGGLWQTSLKIYPHLGAKPQESELQWQFPSGAIVSFRHMKLEEHKIPWQGLQICLLGWEELTHFSQSQFTFLMGSNRSTCGVRPYIRATCNPDADSWVRRLIAPFLDADGYANPDRVGQLQPFIINDEDEFEFVDFDYRDTLGLPAKTLTYISADVWDNPQLLENDPGYLQNLMAQSAIDRARFLGVRGRGGNWNARPAAGKVFRAEWARFVESLPVSVRRVRFWDFASTLADHRGFDPDFTCGALLELGVDGRYYATDSLVGRFTPGQIDRLIAETAQKDGVATAVRWFQDPGQAGVYQGAHLRSLLPGFDAMGVVCNLGKLERSKPLSRALEFGDLLILQRPFSSALMSELVAFPDGAHDDQVDAFAGGYLFLTGHYDRKFSSSRLRVA